MNPESLPLNPYSANLYSNNIGIEGVQNPTSPPKKPAFDELIKRYHELDQDLKDVLPKFLERAKVLEEIKVALKEQGVTEAQSDGLIITFRSHDRKFVDTSKIPADLREQYLGVTRVYTRPEISLTGDYIRPEITSQPELPYQ